MRTYFTLADVFETAFPEIKNNGPFACDNTAYSMDRFLQKCCSIAGYSTPPLLVGSEEEINAWTMWSKYVYPRYQNQIVCFTDSDETNAAKVFANFIGTIYSWLLNSTSRYSYFITNLQANKSSLLNDLTTVTKDRFNDTPQNTGTYDDDEHNTTVSKHESSTLGGTMLSRLNEIEDNLKNFYEDWSNEFRKFIFWSAK